MGRYLVTRAEPGASATAKRLAALGHTPLLAPMATIEPLARPMGLTDVQALLFTSANGVRAFAAQSAARGLPAFCVGRATAAAATAAGFGIVLSADGDSADLAALASRELDSSGGRLLHLGGEDLAGDLAALLSALGFECETRVVYRARTADRVPGFIADALRAGEADGALFHSARTAAAFQDAVGPTGVRTLAAYALSERIAATLRDAPWRQILTSPGPTERLLLGLLPPADSAHS